MPDYKTVNRLPERDWQALVVRQTVFASDANTVTEGEWERLCGIPPERREIRPRSGELVEEGIWADTVLQLVVSPGRIEWRILATPQEDSGNLSSVESITDILEKFVPLIRRWLSSTTITVQRIAFGCVLVHPVVSLEAGYQQLQPYLPNVTLSPNTIRDFLYQINRRRPSKGGLDKMEINRLSKWYMSSWVGLSLGGGNARALHPLSAVTTRDACGLELDINTLLEYPGNLPSEQLVPLFEECVSLGRELIAQGDIP